MPPIEPADLPFLLVHGAWVWKVLLVAIVAAAVGGQVAWRWWRARRTARTAAARYAGEATALHDGEVVVRATVRGGEAATLVLPGAAFHHRAEALTFECGGETVAITGEVEVVAAAHATTNRRRPPAATPAALRSLVSEVGNPMVLRTVRAGDEVIIAGTATVAPGDPAAGYRDSAVGWTIDGGADGRVAAVALRPVAGAMPLTIARLIGTVVIAGGLGMLAMYEVGKSALGQTDAPGRYNEVPAADGLNAYTIPAMMPSSRGRALQTLRYRYREPRTDASLAMAAALAALDGPCAASAHVFEDAERYDLALARGEACGDHDLVVEAALRLGMYDRAAAAAGSLSRPASAGLAFIATGRWTDAARAAEAVAAEREHAAQENDVDIRDAELADAAAFRCLAAQFRTWAGDASARAKLLDGAKANLTCAVLEAATRPPAERLEALRAITFTTETRDWHHFDLVDLTHALIWSEGGTVDRLDGDESEYDSTWGDLDSDLISDRTELTLWFAPFAVAAFTDALAHGSADPGVQRAANRAEMKDAALDVYRGDPARGVERARAVLARMPPDDIHREDAERTIRAIQLHTPATDLAPSDRSLDQDAWIRIGHIADVDTGLLHGGVYPESCGDRMIAAITAASGGDGRDLVRVFGECNVFWIAAPMAILDVLPRVTKGRAELAAALRYFGNEIAQVPFGFLGTAMLRRDHQKLAGDDAAAAWWQTIIDRDLAVLADRDRALALVLWAM